MIDSTKIIVSFGGKYVLQVADGPRDERSRRGVATEYRQIGVRPIGLLPRLIRDASRQSIKIDTGGIDLGKSVFHLVRLSAMAFSDGL
jgi:hypothetical protein